MKQRTFAKHLRRNMTQAENHLWYHLRAYRLNGIRFRRQQPLGPYIVDFVHFGSRVVVEADGGQHNDSESDRKRDDWMQSQGYKVLRFWNHEILQQIEVVLSVIYDTVTERDGSVCPEEVLEAAESALAEDWLKEEEDEAWGR
ncbi:endonuclease domain-containing protein [Marinobacter sp. NP-4(2019)]|uniref:endonuclease domain-containing protein n=1 Tax=Marinobacter sp. NP-4(2019) TaxID=2488665 RepID=UPI000FC3EACF|nr:DUF559 domain-containing protein [Marinobacter sp. NP-4(2019)]AZT84492.1 endonuclease domain-containing protein [Marinobacter sp. NP-4(2019)]